MNVMTGMIGRRLARFLTEPRPGQGLGLPTPRERLLGCLLPGDVLLVEGNNRIATAIKYLTQSTWSHSALYVGAHGAGRLAGGDHCFIEADLVHGVRSVGFEEFEGLHTRICRPVGLTEAERRAVTGFAIARIGDQYDLRNLIDLARYLLPLPPVPARLRRRMLELGSGDPTRAICSTLIAQAFQAIRYPVLPLVAYRPAATPGDVDEVLRIRHHSLYAPRDFDVSPYFRIVKPSLEGSFDFRALTWDSSTPPLQEAPVAE